MKEQNTAENLPAQGWKGVFAIAMPLVRRCESLL